MSNEDDYHCLCHCPHCCYDDDPPEPPMSRTRFWILAAIAVAIPLTTLVAMFIILLQRV